MSCHGYLHVLIGSYNGRYSVENVPLYDSEDDEPAKKFLQAIVPSKDMMITEKENKGFLSITDGPVSAVDTQLIPSSVEPLNSVPMEIDEVKSETREGDDMYSQNAHQSFMHKSAMISRIRSNSACRNYHIDSGPLSKSSPHYSGGKSKNHATKQVNIKLVGERLALAEAREEIYSFEVRMSTCSSLDTVC